MNIEVEEGEEFELGMGRRVRGQRSLGKMKKWLPLGAWASCPPFFEW